MDVDAILGKRKREQEQLGLGEFAKNRAFPAKPAEDDDDDDDGGDGNTQNIDQMLNQLESVKTLDANEVKMMVLQLEKKINKNQQLRMKYIDEPQKFMESEVDLHDHVQNLQSLASVPEFYALFVSLHPVAPLLHLLAHENTDLSADVVELFHELLDMDSLADSEEQILPLVDAVLENNGLDLFVQNLSRFNEDVTEEANAIHNTLGIFEALCTARPESVPTNLCKNTPLLKYLFAKLAVKPFDANKLYASEILAILAQSNRECQLAVGQLVSQKNNVDGIDALLQIAHRYKRREPSSNDEKEMVENIFDALCSCLLVEQNKTLFLNADGLDLMLLMIRERKFASSLALKVISYATSRDQAICDRFVVLLGLKILMPALVKSEKWAQKAKTAEEEETEKADEEHIIAIIASLLSYGQAVTQRRVLNKFCEENFQKLPRLIQMHKKYAAVLAEHDQAKKEAIQQLGADFYDDDDDEEIKKMREYSERLEAGLFTLQQVDLTIAYLVSKCDSEVKRRILGLLKEHSVPISSVLAVLQDLADNIEDETTTTTTTTTTTESADKEEAQTTPKLTKAQVLEMIKQLAD